MSPDLSRLAALRTDGGNTGVAHVLRSREEFTGAEAPEIVMAFDQSFAATGYATLRFGTGAIDVLACGTIKTTSSLTGALEDIDRAVQLADQVKDLLDPRGMALTKVFYETPLKGGHVRNPEVSLMAALAVRLAFRLAFPNYPEPEAVSAKAWKKMASGNANLKDKRVAHNAVAQWPCVRGFDLAKNESQRDAVMVALASQWKGA